MEVGFVTADNTNLLKIDAVMIRKFFAYNTDFFSAECRNIKTALPTDFDPETTIALLIATSGTTGVPKSAAATHTNISINGPSFFIRHTRFPNPTKMKLIVSPLQWVTALINFVMSPILRYTRLQTSQPVTQQHLYELINTYKPTQIMISPSFLPMLITPEGREKCDFTCFETFYVGGSAVTAELIHQVKKVAPKAEVLIVYGMSEVFGLIFINEGANPHSASVGKPMGCFQYRLIDEQTQEDIHRPNISGELWIKGPGVIKSYYRNPEATAEAITEDRWFKTGDIFYRDDHYNFFFVDRIKLLLKFYKCGDSGLNVYKISPVELEAIIGQHPGVLDVVVTGIPDPKSGELPAACVVRRPGHDVGAAEIKKLVKDNLGDSKQLRGGVIFLDAIPQTPLTKIDRRKLKEIAIKKQAEH